MEANGGSGQAAVREDAPSLAEGAALLSRLGVLLAQVERLTAEMVEVVEEIRRSGTVETLEGLPLDLWLGVRGLTGADRWMLLTAGEVLAHLPVTRALFARGVLSWSQVRGIVARVRPLSREERALVDARLGASARFVDRLDPDQVLWAVDRAVDELRGVREVRRREEAAERREFVAVQQDFDGGSRLWGRLGPVSTAVVLNGLHAAVSDLDAAARSGGAAAASSSPAAADDVGADDAAADDAESLVGSRVARGRARGLVEVCARYLGGGSGRRARPSCVVVVDANRVSVTSAGALQVRLPGVTPTLSAAAVEALARDASVRAVVCDGARPLTVTGKVDAARVPAAVRLAVAVRDGGSRFPADLVPASLADVHHVHARAGGGGHHVDDLVLLSGRAHRLVHRHGWGVAVDPADGEVVFTRQGVTLRTRPWGTPLACPPDPPPGLPRGGPPRRESARRRGRVADPPPLPAAPAERRSSDRRHGGPTAARAGPPVP